MLLHAGCGPKGFVCVPPEEKQTIGISISLDIQTPNLRRYSYPQNIPKTPNLSGITVWIGYIYKLYKVGPVGPYQLYMEL